MIYADTSALGRIYFPDERDHDDLRALLLAGDDPVVSSQLARLELTSAAIRAERAGRLADAMLVVAAFDGHCTANGAFTLLRLRAEHVLAAAQALIVRHGLRSLDAMHLAVALEDAVGLSDDGLLFVTRDADQARAAEAEGLPTA